MTDRHEPDAARESRPVVADVTLHTGLEVGLIRAAWATPTSPRRRYSVATITMTTPTTNLATARVGLTRAMLEPRVLPAS